ncbi:hypothetical protein LCGC14_1870090, partial [marine sediment metagenome]
DFNQQTTNQARQEALDRAQAFIDETAGPDPITALKIVQLQRRLDEGRSGTDRPLDRSLEAKEIRDQREAEQLLEEIDPGVSKAIKIQRDVQKKQQQILIDVLSAGGSIEDLVGSGIFPQPGGTADIDTAETRSLISRRINEAVRGTLRDKPGPGPEPRPEPESTDFPTTEKTDPALKAVILNPAAARGLSPEGINESIEKMAVRLRRASVTTFQSGVLGVSPLEPLGRRTVTRARISEEKATKKAIQKLVNMRANTTRRSLKNTRFSDVDRSFVREAVNFGGSGAFTSADGVKGVAFLETKEQAVTCGID